MQQIERGIHYEDAFLGVTLGALTFPHGVILIDAPLRAEDTRSWRSALINQRSGPNRLLISLDAHPDRTLGTRALDCTIVTHQKAAKVFRNRPTIFKGQNVQTGADWETYTDAIGMRWAPPDITFTESMSLHWGGPEVVLEHHPGPTPGSIWVVVPDVHVVFVGDLIVMKQAPFLAFADLEAWQQSLDLLLNTYRNFIIISGRGGPVTGEDVRHQQKIVKEVSSGLEALAKKNAAPEDTEALIPGLLSKCNVPSDLRERHKQRLRYGLYHCYMRRFRATGLIVQAESEDEEQ